MKRNWLATIVISVLIASLASPLIALPTSASEGNGDGFRIVPGAWYRLESDIITVLFPAGGRKPMFIWWYTGAPDQIYIVKYQGLIEYFAFEHPLLPLGTEYYRRLREAWQYRFEEMYIKPEEDKLIEMGQLYRWRLEYLWRVMSEIGKTWHSPYLPFNAGNWSLTDVENITTPEGKTIGISFAFKLVDLPAWMPKFQFAENNIMIKVRFYSETVEETIPETGYKYVVNAGEMKMDFVVSKWIWNIDAIKQLIQELNQETGLSIKVPEGKSRLALWVNLASINMTNLELAEDEPERIEEHSTASYVDIEDTREDIRENRTETAAEQPILASRPIVKLRFANETTTLDGFFRFVSSAEITDYPNPGDVNMVPVKAAYIAGGHHMRLFLGYPYFGNGTLEHDPSIGVDEASVTQRQNTQLKLHPAAK